MGIVFAVLYFFGALLIFPFMLLMSSFAPPGPGAPGPIGPGAGAGVGLLLLILYPIGGFVFGVLFAAIYNLVARLTGGVELTLRPAQEEVAPWELEQTPH